MDKSSLKSTKLFGVVTGASSGIGKELAKQFVEHGYDLVIVAEDDGINDVATELSSRGGKVEPYKCDLRRPQAVQDLYNHLKQHHPAIDAIAVNAGVGVGGRFVENDLQEEVDMINLNVLSVVHLTKLVLKDMVASNHGKFLFTSSVVADIPNPYLCVYAATKAFVHSFVQGLRIELDQAKVDGVTLTALQPGATETNFFNRAHMEGTKVAESEKDDPAQVAKQGFEAMMAGEASVVGGAFMNKVQNVVNKFMPETVNAKMSAQQAKPGSANQ